MNETEFENLIQQTMHTDINPSSEGFTHMMASIELTPVTENEKIRYTIQTTSSNIINTIIQSLKSTRMVLVPSLVLVILIGGVSIGSKRMHPESAIEKLAEQSETIADEAIDLDDSILLTSFEAPAMNDLTTNQNDNIF
jgi:hypothetical protein